MLHPFWADTTHGPAFMNAKRYGLFFRIRKTTPVCTTELGYTVALGDEFKARNVKAIMFQ